MTGGGGGPVGAPAQVAGDDGEAAAARSRLGGEGGGGHLRGARGRSPPDGRTAGSGARPGPLPESSRVRGGGRANGPSREAPGARESRPPPAGGNGPRSRPSPGGGGVRSLCGAAAGEAGLGAGEKGLRWSLASPTQNRRASPLPGPPLPSPARPVLLRHRAARRPSARPPSQPSRGAAGGGQRERLGRACVLPAARRAPFPPGPAALGRRRLQRRRDITVMNAAFSWSQTESFDLDRYFSSRAWSFHLSG
ncbi:uncharacterized protein M6D78_012294 [Vipera latastei]